MDNHDHASAPKRKRGRKPKPPPAAAPDNGNYDSDSGPKPKRGRKPKPPAAASPDNHHPSFPLAAAADSPDPASSPAPRGRGRKPRRGRHEPPSDADAAPRAPPSPPRRGASKGAANIKAEIPAVEPLRWEQVAKAMPSMDAVVKVFCVHTEPNFSLPWQRKRQYSSSSSGFIIGGRRVLTNAHSVEHYTQVKLKKRGLDTKYLATVLAIGTECDIAMLTVEDDEFWKGVSPVEFGSLPALQDAVTVVGYPIGGDTISVTSGVVSRIEILSYVHGSTELLGLLVQDVVLLDDEDVQPEEPVDWGVPDKWTEPKIYYPSRDDPEAVELTSSDIKCLDPGVYLSSPVINYYIQYIKRTKLCNEDCRDKLHIFNTYFYSKLREALLGKGEFSKFRRWWKGVNIFHRGYIILPIHGTAHWSLIIICIPAKERNSGPIILHLDSLGMHPSAEIFDIVARFLEAEWCHLRKNPPPDISISETIWEYLPRNIHKEKVQVPRQNNEYDCGIFMLYYIERFIREAPERFTRDKLGMFSRSWFKSEDASELRQRIQELLLEEFESARLDDAMSGRHI